MGIGSHTAKRCMRGLELTTARLADIGQLWRVLGGLCGGGGGIVLRGHGRVEVRPRAWA
jgi:hypothetical protein